MPHKIEQYDSLSDLEKDHTKSVYLRNEKDKRRGVEYAMSKVLGFYKECLKLGPEYLTEMDDDGEVTFYAAICTGINLWIKCSGIRYSLKDKNKAKPDKTKHGMEEREEVKVKNSKKSNSK
ncbi:hypothetical protein Tco_0113127, partial [Tanacetum coccineum]